MVASPSASLSESDELSSAASSAVVPPFFVSGSSSGSSSILGFDILIGRMCLERFGAVESSVVLRCSVLSLRELAAGDFDGESL